MATQFIVNDKGEKTAVIVPINEYEDLLHHHQQELELTDEYKAMIDNMLQEEPVSYVDLKTIEDRFKNK